VVGEQAVAALGLADVLGGEGQGLGELLGEGVELGRVAFDELELELAEGLAAPAASMWPLSIMASTLTPSRGVRMTVSRRKWVVNTGTRRGWSSSRRFLTSSRSMAEKSKQALA
jgi:hypothetical protein